MKIMKKNEKDCEKKIKFCFKTENFGHKSENFATKTFCRQNRKMKISKQNENFERWKFRNKMKTSKEGKLKKLEKTETL